MPGNLYTAVKDAVFARERKIRMTTGESRQLECEFAAKLASGETLASGEAVTSVPSTGLTLASAARSGTKVTVQASAGTDGDNFQLTFTVVTSSSNTIECVGRLEIRDD